MLKNIFILIKGKLWFLTIGKWNQYKARKRLAAYVATLSPEQRAWANELRLKLDKQKADAAANTLLAEIGKVSVKQHRVTEAIDRIQGSV